MHDYYHDIIQDYFNLYANIARMMETVNTQNDSTLYLLSGVPQVVVIVVTSCD